MRLAMHNAAALGALVAVCFQSPAASAQSLAGRVSSPGRYDGYSPVLYDGYQMSSQYVAMRDGTRIAIDIVRPTLRGKLVDKPLPVVWMNTPYNRRTTDGEATIKYYPGAALALVKFGYVIAVADMRGNYASFGKALHANRNEWMPWAYWDAYDMTEWLARQPWSDSKIGMWGCSATGHSQWQAAATRPPHLKAIFPMSAPSDYYNWGGVISPEPWPEPEYPGAVPDQDASAVAVDGDADGALLHAAKEEHRYNLDYGSMPFRDSISPFAAKYLGLRNFHYWLVASTLTHLAEINRAAIPAYETANFGEDQRVKLGVFLKLRNVTAPMKLVVGPDRHCTWTSDFRASAINHFNISSEELRWFDYWLKGVPNGVMNEPPIYYYTYNLPEKDAWHFAWQWPLPSERRVRYFLAAPRNASLSAIAPTDPAAADSYKVDYGVTPANRNMRGMTYTTAPMATDTPMIGHPILHLWVSSTVADGDFVTSLADVGPDGTVTPLPGTDDGQLRASHRALNHAPYDNLGLPYHRSFASDVKPLVPGQPAELTFDLAPISWVFKAGHRLRLIIWCTGAPHKDEPRVTPILSPPPTVRFYRDAAHPSYLAMPETGPVRPLAHLARSNGGTVATLTFPPSLDARYVADVGTEELTLAGVRASSLTVHGRTIVAEFRARPTGRAVIAGRFGKIFDYGPWMRFEAEAKP